MPRRDPLSQQRHRRICAAGPQSSVVASATNELKQGALGAALRDVILYAVLLLGNKILKEGQSLVYLKVPAVAIAIVKWPFRLTDLRRHRCVCCDVVVEVRS